MKLGTPNLTRREMGDPAAAYERAEAQTCQGCANETFIVMNTLIPFCALGRKYGRKCPRFRVRKAVERTKESPC